MRSLQIIRTLLVSAAMVALSGCLVSENPVLDARTGRATPIAAGAYEMCPVGEKAKAGDCERFFITIDKTKLYRLENEGDEEPAEMRLRRVGRNGYAVQLIGENDDGYSYYYGRKDDDSFFMTLMMCSDLPEALREKLIANGGFTLDGESRDICGVKTIAALAAAAKAYHNGDAEEDEKGFQLRFAPVE